MPTDSGPEGVNERLRDMLRAAGKTQTDVALAVGVDQSQISKRLLGQIEWRLSELALVARLLDVKLSALVEMDVA